MLLLITFTVLIFVREAPPDISALSYKPRAYKFMYKQQFMFTYKMKKPLLQDVYNNECKANNSQDHLPI